MKLIALLLASLPFIIVAQTTAADSVDTDREPLIDLDIGGALRFNYNLSSWKPEQMKRGGDFGFETLRFNIDASKDRLSTHIDLRHYAEEFGGTFLKYGWMEYALSDSADLKIGLIPAYFGTQQYNSHSWFFNLPFYLGFEDDHDMGISYSMERKRYTLDIGLYKNAEERSFSDNGPISDRRYTYDFAGSNKEVNQVITRMNYKAGANGQHRIGFTIQYGGIWNIDTREVGEQQAIAGHYDWVGGRWNVKLQALAYDNKPINAEGESRNSILMTAYNAPYNTAAQAQIYTVGLSYKVPMDKGMLTALEFYNDYAYMDKSVAGWQDTQMNVTGVLVHADPMYIYIDHARGLHQPWLGPQWMEALTTGDPDNGWESRTNINVGYYF